MSPDATTTSPENRDLWAVASAVFVAVTGRIDDPSGGDDPVRAVTDLDSLKTYVESYLDGYEVTPASLEAAVAEGTALTVPTLEELISQASEVDLDIEEFFEDGEFSVEAGAAAAATFAADEASRPATVRQRLIAAWSAADERGECILVLPSDVYNAREGHSIARQRILERGLPEGTPYVAWGRHHDPLLPDGTFARGESCLEVFGRGDREVIVSVLRRAEALGFVVRAVPEGARFVVSVPGAEVDPSTTRRLRIDEVWDDTAQETWGTTG